MRTNRQILFLLFLVCIQHLAGFAMQAHAGMPPVDDAEMIRIDLQPGVELPPVFLSNPAEDEDASIRAKQSRRRGRFYISAPAKQFNFTPQVAPDHSDRIFRPETEEKKTGVYLQQDAFLPAYYQFLFRFTLF
ncbi:hypothetical protein [Chitinophaga deserti]|uniref:hypothetical protein n=1 Tax=Chitinophaga deserti TaxID=2164099 RepID=UPI0013007796|nr:hypothetical protein [Chitinophaga deserti]